MKAIFILLASAFIVGYTTSCEQQEKNAEHILGNPEYPAICYGGYRDTTREVQPTTLQLKEDIKILHASGFRIMRTYNVHFPHASNILKAIRELKKEDSEFEMYVMLGIWIDCKNAWTGQDPDHEHESERNQTEIATAVSLANEHQDIVKVLAVGNEAMVHWQAEYFVQPRVILKWVKYLQEIKAEGRLPKSLWITSSDDFASWGGGEEVYKTEDLNELIKAVDYISMHTYPFHNTHYNPKFWKVPTADSSLSKIEKVDLAMIRSIKFAIGQYDSVYNYMKGLGVDKPIHIGETGWATVSDGLYGSNGSHAADEYKQAAYYKGIRSWADNNGVTCFFFEAFDEHWKVAANLNDSENHFGLFTVEGQAKYPIWDLVDSGVYEGLTRDEKQIIKTHNGDRQLLLEDVLVPPTAHGITILNNEEL